MKRVRVALICVLLLGLACSTTKMFYKFEEPESLDSMLVVGRVILQDYNFTERIDVMYSNIEVAVFGRSDEGEKLGMWATTDKNGYFALANVPSGQYTLKGIRATLSTGTRIIISNPLLQERHFFRFHVDENIVFDGDYFAYDRTGDIVSLKHNLFKLNPKATMFALEHRALQTLDNVELVDGRVVEAGPVEEYFVEKYPESHWVDELRASARVNRTEN